MNSFGLILYVSRVKRHFVKLLDLTHSFMIGDAVSDIQAADAVRVQGILVLTGRGVEHASLLKAHGLKKCPVLANLSAAVDYVLRKEEQVV